MKAINQKCILKCLLILQLSILNSYAWGKKSDGGVIGGGGGDSCESKIKSIRDNLKVWIKNGGGDKLSLPDSLSSKSYSLLMLDAIEKTKIECSFDKVMVWNTEKTCKFENTGFVPKITCNLERFMKNSSSEEQIVLIHHEYAGVAMIELPNMSDSNYEISKMISPFTEKVLVSKLSLTSSVYSFKNTLNSSKFYEYKKVKGTGLRYAFYFSKFKFDLEKFKQLTSIFETLPEITKSELENFLLEEVELVLLNENDEIIYNYSTESGLGLFLFKSVFFNMVNFNLPFIKMHLSKDQSGHLMTMNDLNLVHAKEVCIDKSFSKITSCDSNNEAEMKNKYFLGTDLESIMVFNEEKDLTEKIIISDLLTKQLIDKLDSKSLSIIKNNLGKSKFGFKSNLELANEDVAYSKVNLDGERKIINEILYEFRFDFEKDGTSKLLIINANLEIGFVKGKLKLNLMNVKSKLQKNISLPN